MNDNIEKPLGDPGTEREDLLLQKTIQLEKDAARWKREEAALRDMERRYLALAENPLAVLLVLSGERVTYMNRCGETFFGFSLRDHPRFPITDFVAPGFCSEVERILLPADEEGIWERRLTFPVLTPHDGDKWIDLAVTPVGYRGDNALLAIGIEVPSPDLTGTTEENDVVSAVFPGAGEDVVFAVLNEDGAPLFLTEGFRRESALLWGDPAVEGSPILDIVPAGDTGVPFRLAFEKAWSGERTEIGQETGERYFSLAFSPVFSREGQITTVSLSISDKTGERVLQRKLREQEDMNRKFLAISSDMLVAFTPDEGRILECSNAFLSRIGLEREKVEGQTLGGLGLVPYGSVRPKLVTELEEKGTVRDFELAVTTVSGSRFNGILSAVKADTGKGPAVLASIREKMVQVPAAIKKETVLPMEEVQSGSPAGIPGRDDFEKAMAAEMERVVRFRGSLSVILFSLDGRADISAEMGEDIAEKLMTDFISVVKSRIRSMDFLARLEENEFVVLTSMSGYLAQQMADKIRDTVCHHKFLPGRGVTCSLGVCEYRKEISSGEMVKRASLALREGKRAGGNRAVLAPSI